MESFDSIAKTDTNESMAKKDSTDLITEVDSNQDVESLGVDSRDSIPEIYSNKKFDADSVHQLKEFEKETTVKGSKEEQRRGRKMLQSVLIIEYGDGSRKRFF
ncbi:PREDICTED: uncharacterized protein LOC106293679 isoform X1 [Brassica oleracea var. oleracea]|uniref:uncharacterized protein LOC106293679 isoform X1 n=1 Tax=Brassica oleracea var. oleracea TaxID=109376 RepID=UPI0006A72CAB|nr:PREDICTED: uncharacterized protein LOC106293679 isoform X1 [Brassica oleracea var. oleracea]